MSCCLPRQGASHRCSVIIPVLLFIVFSIFMAKGASAFTVTALGDFDNVTVMEVSGSFDALDPYGQPNLEPRRIIAREFYRTHGDDYDFLVIFTNFDFLLPPGVKAFFAPARNNVSGIGLPLSDATSHYSHDSSVLEHLEGTIDMGTLGSHVLEPSDPGFDDTLMTLTHEFLHRWGAYVHFLDNGSASNALLGAGQTHWSLLFDSGGSSLYGSHWQDNGDGTFTSIAPEQAGAGEAIGRTFNPLELYLMGLLDKTRVPPMLLIDAPGFDPAQLPQIGLTIPGIARTVTIDDIIAAEGERIPTVADGNGEFRMAFVYAVIPGTWSDTDAEDLGEIAAINRLQHEWEKRFSIITGGTAIMHTAFVAPGAEETNPETVMPGFTPAQVQSVNSGVNWLISHQQPGGYWQDQPGSELRDTAATVKALKGFPLGNNAVTSGQIWLGTAMSENRDFLARKLLGLAGTGVSEFLLSQNADGGWGCAPGYVSNSVDTALMLQALISRDAAGPASAAAASYLHDSQNPDGAWGVGYDFSLVQATARALLALNGIRQLYPLEPVIADGLDWLTARQNPDGGFGSSVSIVVDTAVALQAIKAIGGTSTAIDGALGYLLNRQDLSGSWNGSVFQTSQAVEALYAGQIQADLMVVAGDSNFDPATVSALPSPVTVTMFVRNLGSEAAQSVSVAIFDGDPAAGPPVWEQAVDVPGNGVVPVSFSMTVTEPGLHAYQVVIDGDNRIVESNEWNNTAQKLLAAGMAPPPAGFVAAASAGSEAVTVVPLAVTLGYPWPKPITVNYAVNAASTAIPSVDYVLTSGTLTFAPGETNKSIDLAVVNDLVAETDKTAIIELASPSLGTLGTARHIYTIRDDEAPAVTITSPPAEVIGQSVPQLLYATTGGNVVVKVDGRVVAKVEGDILDPLADGAHSVEVSAANSFGMSTTARVDFTVDTALPTVTILSPTTGAVTNARPLLDYTVTSAIRTEILVDAVPVTVAAGNPLGPLSDGMHILTVNAWNAAGTKSSSQIEFRTDGRAPVVKILYPPNDYIRDANPVLRYRADESGPGTVWLDDIEISPVTGQMIGPLSGGVHRLRVAVTDAVGNVGGDEVNFAVSVAGEPPFELAGNWPGLVAGAYGGIAADPDGNLCLVTRHGEKEFAIARYDRFGRQIRYAVRSSDFNVSGGIWVDIAPKDIAVDSHGDIYVVGWGWATSQNLSVLAKYDADGNYVAHVLFDPEWLGADVELSSVHVDQNDHIYVAGKAEISLFTYPKTNATMFVAKFDRQLNHLQGRSFGDPYTDPSSFYFVSRDALTVDREQNVWITGKDSGNRLLVWKLAPDLNRTGVEAVGPPGTQGMDIDIDLSGNLYVAGNGPSGGTVWKYSSADGRIDAVRDMVSPVPLPSLVVQGDGSVIVVDEAGTVKKLDRNLETLWSTSLGGDFDSKLVLSPTNQLFVGGSDGSGNPVASIAGISDPRQPRFNFSKPNFYTNTTTAVLSGYLDPGFNVVLEGKAYDLLDYSHDAVSGEWQLVVGGFVEGDNPVVVSIANDLGLAKRYPTEVIVDTIAPLVTIQEPLDGSCWTSKPWLSYTASEGDIRVFVNGVDVSKGSGARLDSLRPGENRIRVQCADAAGNVGFDEVVIQTADAAIGEYPLTPGDIRPVRVSGDQTVIDTGSDAAGNIYVFGETVREMTGYTLRDLYVAKYGPVGNLLNFWPIDGNSIYEYGAALVVAGNGEFLVAYNSNIPSGQYVTVARFAADGTLLWRDDMSSGAGDAIRDLALDATGNVYACGETAGRLNNKKYGGNGDYFLVKYTPQGTRLWTVLSNASTYESLRSIGVADDGFLYGGGWRDGDRFMTLFKFDPNGSMLWRKDYAYPRELLGAERMKVGRDGSFNTFVELKTSVYPYYYYLSKHDRDGNFVAGAYGEGLSIKGAGLALDAAGNVYVTGSSDDPYGLGWSFAGNRSFGDEDIFIAKYAAADLQVLWTAQAGDAMGQEGRGIIFSPVDGRAYLAGIADGETAGTGYTGVDMFLSPLVQSLGSSGPDLRITGYRTPTKDRFQTISGHATPGSLVTVVIPATSPATVSPVRQDADGAWSFVVSNLAADGDNVLVVGAANGFGTVEQTLTITVDNTPPFLTIDPVTSPTNRSSQTVTGSIEANAILTVAGVQGAIPVVDGHWNYVVEQMQTGDNIITFTATDAVGNRTVRTVAITYLPPPPPTLTMIPERVTAGEATDVTLQIDGISPPGATVTVTQFLDLDGNGLVDVDDPVVRRFTVTDGIFHENPNIVSDVDGSTDGTIVAHLNYRFSNDRYHAAGQYLFVAEIMGGVAVQPLEVVAASQPQSLAGAVRNEQGLPVAGALIELHDPWGRSHGYAVTDRSGRYRFGIRTPGDYRPLPLAEGYAFDREAGSLVVIPAGQTVTLDLAVMAGARQFGGRVIDATSGAGLAGMLVRAESSRYLAAGMTADDGSYHLQLPDGDYGLAVEGRPGDGLAALGYVGSLAPLLTIKVDSDLAGIDLSVNPGTIIDCGKVADAVGNGIGGIPVLAVAADDTGHVGEGCSDAQGRYCVARTAGEPWRLLLDDRSAQGAGVIGTVGTSYQPDLTVYPIDAQIAGRVRNVAGEPLAGVAMEAGHAGGAGTASATSMDGRYQLGVSSEPAGDWSLLVHGEEAGFAAVPSVVINVLPGQTVMRDFTLVSVLDNTIVVTKAAYDTRKKVLSVEATSNYENAALQVVGYGPMTFSRLLKGKYYWSYSGKIAVKPATVTVFGPEGSKTVIVQ